MQKYSNKAHIKEIFSSIQGEGLFVGEKHIFVRFCTCNLKCAYCDTEFSKENSQTYSIDELFEKVKNENATLSLTGGEPLCENEFLAEFLKKYKSKLNKIYLETNGTLYNELSEIIDYIDIVSMDIKLKSSAKQKNRFLENEKFLDIASKKEVFIKVVFDNNIEENEIKKVVNIAKKHNTLIILQPKMPLSRDLDLMNIFDKFYTLYKNVRLIPQTHKFLNLA